MSLAMPFPAVSGPIVLRFNCFRAAAPAESQFLVLDFSD